MLKLLAVLALLGSSTLLASPLTVFSNFGEGQSFYKYNPTAVAGSSFTWFEEAVAVPFTPTDSVALTQLDLALGMLGLARDEVGSITIQLLADNSDQPGSILADLGNFTAPSTPSVLTATCSSCASLVKGARYWVAVFPGDGKTAVGWEAMDQDTTGQVAFLMPLDSRTWTVSNGRSVPAFDVIGIGGGSAVPEPSAGWLLWPIIGALYLTRRHRAV